MTLHIGFTGLSLVLAASIASGQVAERRWAEPVEGDWLVPLNWTPSDVPDSLAEAAIIDAQGSYTVSVRDAGRVFLDRIGVIAPGATLDARNTRLWAASGFRNEGTVVLGLANGDFRSGGTIIAGSSFTIEGSGTVRMELSAGLIATSIAIEAAPFQSITNGENHTIWGSGRIQALLTNLGTIISAPTPVSSRLRFDSNSIHNRGLIIARPDSQVFLPRVVTQTSDAELRAEGEIHTDIEGSLINAGRVVVTPGGELNLFSTTMTPDSLTNEGRMELCASTVEVPELPNDGTIEIDRLGVVVFDVDTVVNNGVITLDRGTLQIEGHTAFTGSGQVMSSNQSGGARIDGSGPDSSLTLGQGQTLSGRIEVGLPITIGGTVAPRFGMILERGASMSSTTTLELGARGSRQNANADRLWLAGGPAGSPPMVYTLGGAIVLRGQGFSPSVGARLLLVGPAPGQPDGTVELQGTFGSVSLPVVPRVRQALFQTESEVYVEYFCLADVNTDGLLNSADVGAFVRAFAAGDPIADFNNNGVVTLLDVELFMDAFVDCDMNQDPPGPRPDPQEAGRPPAPDGRFDG